ncbi:MAG: hypothetical protein GF383_12110, partial [Candidatus Lokiarchaeota archaeon]|nr:hypothetical protein [Candidatus Lokiarchaeota archaeon]MBD3341682.1 hypothetical protein [Candidatus Lokiarchaeota archaeon]
MKERLCYWWQFESLKANKTLDSVNKNSAKLRGNYKLVEGIKGSALKFDGFTSYLECNAKSFPKSFGSEGFTLEAWIALGSYPWNWCPILDHHHYPKKGYYFGVDDEGQIVFYLATELDENQWQGVTSETSLDLRRWYHIVGVFDPTLGVSIYIDGKESGNASIAGKFVSAPELSIMMGKHRKKAKPTNPVQDINLGAHFPLEIFLDGILDEVRIYDQSIDIISINNKFKGYGGSEKKKIVPPISIRKLPSVQDKIGEFRAYYTKLEYYDEWDSLWRMGPYADVVVNFDENPCKLIFWRGTNYIPCWVTENELWYTNEFNETWTSKNAGCCEPMSDKHCRHSHVRIIENNKARILIHWRHALIDVQYNLARIDKTTGWGDWSDEVHIIYPDGIAVRKITLYSSQPRAPHEYQESILVLSPGTSPDDAINLEALYLINMKGDIQEYSWAEEVPDYLDKPDGANIELINLKSNFKPFIIISDSPISKRKTHPIFRCFNADIDSGVSHFPWWNHWPVASIPSDGRKTKTADKASHTSLSNIVDWASYEETPNSITKLMLTGLTDKDPKELLQIAKSWLYPPELVLRDSHLIYKGYDPSDRAYIIELNQRLKLRSDISFSILANEDSPIYNPCIILKNCESKNLRLIINGEILKKDKDYRLG